MGNDAADGRRGNSTAIAAAFADGPAYVPYLAVGDPDYESSKAYVEALDRGVPTSSNSASRSPSRSRRDRRYRARSSARSTPA